MKKAIIPQCAVDDRAMTFTLVIPVDVEKITVLKIDLEDYLKTQAALQIRQLLKKEEE